MTLAELVSNVYTITGRPDRVAETSAAIQSATLRGHQSDYYYKDIYESGIAFSSSDYVQSLDYRALLSRWRALKYLRKYDYTNAAPGMFLTLIPPELVLDRYKVQKQDVCYVAGEYVQINSATQEQYYLLGCYINPDVTSTGYSSWIALDHPWFIIYDAAAKVEIALGKLEEAKVHAAMAEDELNRLRVSNIQPEGF